MLTLDIIRVTKMKTYYKVRRVSYGKKETPAEDREYRPMQGGPVGTIKDWIQYAKEQGYDGVEWTDNILFVNLKN